MSRLSAAQWKKTQQDSEYQSEDIRGGHSRLAEDSPLYRRTVKTSRQGHLHRTDRTCWPGVDGWTSLVLHLIKCLENFITFCSFVFTHIILFMPNTEIIKDDRFNDYNCGLAAEIQLEYMHIIFWNPDTISETQHWPGQQGHFYCVIAFYWFISKIKFALLWNIIYKKRII